MEAKFLASLFSFLSIFLAIYADETGLIANYNFPENKTVKFSLKGPLVLSCEDKTGITGEITWLRNNTNVKEIPELKGRHRIITAENKFIIDKTKDEGDDGLYSCTKGEFRADIIAVSEVVVKVPSNVGVVEGEKLSISCTVLGTNPQIKWIIEKIEGNVTIENSTEHYLLKQNDKSVENAVLTIENVSLEDRGEYKCVGQNSISNYEDRTTVRVKGKLAALWPFLGICAEVLVLCAIILIYEKRRNKTELEESDTDPQDQQSPQKRNTSPQANKTSQKNNKIEKYYN